MNSLSHLISSVVPLVLMVFTVHTCMPKEWPWIPASLTQLTFPDMETPV